MEFIFHLFVQKHANRTYTVTPLPFFDLTAYGINLDEIKRDLSDALAERIKEIPARNLHSLEFDSRVTLRKVKVELRPIDRKTRKKRREQIKLTVSLLVKKDDDGQYVVSVPKLGTPPLVFYAYNWGELDATAAHELTAWFDGMTLEQILDFQHARTETLETLTVEVSLRKPRDEPDGGDSHGGSAQRFWALRETGINLTAQAAEGRFRRTYRREEAVDLILKTLAGTRNASVLVTGPAEVGKSAVLHEVVRRIQQKDCADVLHEREVWLLTPDRLIAGAQYIGTWEERLKDIVAECREKQHILFVEDLPGLIEIGRWAKSDQNVAQALKPHIESGEVVVVGEASEDRLRMGEGAAAGFINLFRRVTLDPLSEEETLSLLGSVSRDLERELHVRLEPNALEASVELARRFWPYRAFPGKAIRLLEASAADAIQKGKTPSSHSLLRPLHAVRREQVITTFAVQTGLPEFIVSDQARLDPDEVKKYFESRILGQTEAIQAMVDLVTMVKAGLNDPGKPLGTFLFIGPTGVGKTQMAKALASYLFGHEDRLIRFDMSEYIGGEGVGRLTGAFGGDGELTRRVREQPFCVLLLDEFEKADPRIFDIMLQVFGEGRLTDSTGRTTYFHNAIIVMTSNLGSEQRAFRPPGFVGGEGADDQALENHYRSRIEDYFRPEFVNRIDQIVIFRKLDVPALRQIASRELGEILLRDGITRRSLLVEIDETVIDRVLEQGYSPIYGARPLKREIERLVVAPLARTLARRNSQDQTLLRVLVDDGEIAIKTVPIDEASRTATVALSSSLDPGMTRRMKLDGQGIVEGLARIRRQLAEWDEHARVNDMRAEKDRLLAAMSEPDFWDDGDRARERMTRFYFLDRLLKRLKQLLDKAEYLEEFAVLVNRERDSRYQTELASDYEDLHRNASYLNIELLTAHLPHRNQAMLLISSLGTPAVAPADPHATWPRRLSEIYLRWAERKGYDRDLYLLMPESGAPGESKFELLDAGNFRKLLKQYARAEATDEIAIFLQGSNVFGFLKGERGVHKLAAGEASGEEHARVQVFAIPDGTSIPAWLGDYQAIKHEIALGKRQAPPAEKHSVIRTYALERADRYIRDMRTDIRLSNVSDVLNKGLLDEFILAYLENEEAKVSWEDRFPRTFPF